MLIMPTANMGEPRRERGGRGGKRRQRR